MTKEEFKIQVVPVGEKLYRLAYRLLKDPDDAKDALQEVYIKLWKLKDRLKEYNSIEAFAMTITKNHCLDKIKLKKTVTLESKHTYYKSNDDIDPQIQLELKDDIKNISKLLSLLPEQQRIILELRDMEGYSYEEIEEVMNLPVNTIRVNLSRARKKIREFLIKMNSYGYGQDTATA
jgi:RNA polymerase sigma factor (sigma-70 family)